VTLHDVLVPIWPSPVVELNRAAAVGYSHGPETGLAIADRIANSGQLVTYPHLHVVRGDLLARAGRHPEAAQAFSEAARLTRNEQERDLFANRAAAERRT
jgi:predicted RNA polymerase sigma factor